VAKGAPLLIAALVAFALLSCSENPRSSCPPQFDSAAWKHAGDLDAEQESVRRELAGQLDRCGFIDGASKERVRRLLGEPSPEDERSWMYYVGETAWGIDSDWLFVEFSRKSRVEGVGVAQG